MYLRLCQNEVILNSLPKRVSVFSCISIVCVRSSDGLQTCDHFSISVLNRKMTFLMRSHDCSAWAGMHSVQVLFEGKIVPGLFRSKFALDLSKENPTLTSALLVSVDECIVPDKPVPSVNGQVRHTACIRHIDQETPAERLLLVFGRTVGKRTEITSVSSCNGNLCIEQCRKPRVNAAAYMRLSGRRVSTRIGSWTNFSAESNGS